MYILKSVVLYFPSIGKSTVKLFNWFVLHQVCGRWGKVIRQLPALLSKSFICFEGPAFRVVKGEWVSASVFFCQCTELGNKLREAASYHSRLGADCFPPKQ